MPARILPGNFNPRPRPRVVPERNGLAGLFWCQPEWRQRERVRELIDRSGLSLEQISTVCRVPLSTVRTLAEAGQ